jgi:hypothetical protein
MRFSVSHGADRVPLHEGDDGQLTSVLGIPFHGIASRALLPWLHRLPDGSALWERTAHRLHCGGESGSEELTALREEAGRHGVLSLTESCRAARLFVEARFGERLCDGHSELWNTKEGHTSSVWVVTVRSRDGEPVERFVLNVARDPIAGVELRESSERLDELSRRHPGLPIAQVHEVTEVVVRLRCGDVRVAVTRNELVEDALEIHPLAPGAGGEHRYALVERFLTGDASPTAIRAVRGREASAAESESIDGASSGCARRALRTCRSSSTCMRATSCGTAARRSSLPPADAQKEAS